MKNVTFNGQVLKQIISQVNEPPIRLHGMLLTSTAVRNDSTNIIHEMDMELSLGGVATRIWSDRGLESEVEWESIQVLGDTHTLPPHTSLKECPVVCPAPVQTLFAQLCPC